MPQLPFEIPRSLTSYVDQFDSDPEKAISRLQSQLERRGPNAVGFFLLAWFFHLKGDDEAAVEQAMLARIHAPGSPFLEKLPYYLSHPDLLNAWTPERTATDPHVRAGGRQTGPVMDLDRLIEQLSSVESKRISPDSGEPAGDDGARQSSEEDVDDIISDTLADIHARQGKTKLALTLYRRLLNRHDDREDYYREQIEKLEQRLESGDGKNRP